MRGRAGMTAMAAMSCSFTAALGARRVARVSGRHAGRKVAPSMAAKEVFPEDEAPTASGKVRVPRVIPARKQPGKVDEIFPEDEAPTASGKKRSPRTIPARATLPGGGMDFGNAWYPGAVAPEYLDGSMPGDYGFDPLRLGADPEKRRFFQEAELMNARFAMLAVPGILFTNATGLDNWATAGQTAMEGKPYELWQLILAEVIFFAFVEGKRWQGYKNGETRPFDPAGMDSPAARVKEIKTAASPWSRSSASSPRPRPTPARGPSTTSRPTSTTWPTPTSPSFPGVASLSWRSAALSPAGPSSSWPRSFSRTPTRRTSSPPSPGPPSKGLGQGYEPRLAHYI